MVITIIMNTHSQTKNAEQEYKDLAVSLQDIDSDIFWNKWTSAIEKLEVASTTLSPLPKDERHKTVLETIRTLMSECIRKAPTAVIASMSDTAWAICSENPILERRELLNGNHVKVPFVPFSVSGSNLDPLCLCRPRARKHWCAWCAELDPQKYTVGGLLAHKASK
jgi:hypothetical protein